MNFISRKFEWEADRFACELQDKVAVRSGEKEEENAEMADMGEGLSRALITLHVKNLSTVWVDWMYVHSILTLPIHHRPGKCVNLLEFFHRYSVYHHSHPTLTERLKALEAFQVQNAKKSAVAKKELSIILSYIPLSGVSVLKRVG